MQLMLEIWWRVSFKTAPCSSSYYFSLEIAFGVTDLGGGYTVYFCSFWSTGLTDSTLEVLAMFIPELPNLRQMVLDNNPVSGEGFSLLIREDSPLHHLSLRYNGITDRGAEELGRLLGSPTRSNQKLLSLNLNGNRITDKGLAFIAEVPIAVTLYICIDIQSIFVHTLHFLINKGAWSIHRF